MISHASRSKTPPRPPAAAPIPTRLAPGFRFHPTDDELVSYYLRRKVAGLPIRVNAISEIDLYKTEPWDLPPQSMLRSRDLEWYFFTALDRKYSNRSRTNRATVEGYWKTTGKDRPVRPRSRKIGMKKTLVYHTGRAPRGQRTNWVMHEYRLEDDDLARDGIPQDGYVLCRIFQKSGPGPQNGAQYGAPFEEEEWERDEEEEADIVPGSDALIGCEDYVHLADFFENQDAGTQHSDATPLVVKSVEQDTSSKAEDSSNPMEEIPKDKVSVEDFSTNVDFPALQENIAILNGVRENSIVVDQASTQNNGYVQLNDIVEEENTCFTSDEYSNDCENLPTKPASSLIIDQTCTDQHAMHVEPYGLPDDVPWVYASSPQLAEDNNMMYYDALGHDLQYLETSFPNDASLVPRAGFDFLEELMAYYDATDDTLHYVTADSCIPKSAQVNPSHSVESSSSAEADCTSLGAVSVRENAATSASFLKTSNIISTVGGSSDNFSADCGAASPHNGLGDKTLMKRLASVLESISAPPAFAAEPAAAGKIAGHISAASTSSFHVTGMIQIRNLIDTRCSSGLTSPKHCGPGFLFMYAVDGKVAGEALLHERLKFHGGLFSSFLRGGIHSFFLRGLMLALSCRVMAYAYSLCS